MRKSIPQYLMDASGRLYRISPVTEVDREPCFRVIPVERGAELHSELRVRYGLTDREAEIALLLGRRATNSEIAEELGISLHTVRHHAGRILEKAKLKSRAQVQGVVARCAAPRHETSIEPRRN